MEHYGFSQKRKAAYQNLKNFVNNEHEKFMEEAGIVRRKRNLDEVLLEELSEVSTELDQFLNDMDLGSSKSDEIREEAIKVNLNGVTFPEYDIRGKVLTGDTISNIGFKIKNNRGSSKQVHYKLYVNQGGEKILSIAESDINVMGSTEKLFGPFDLNIKAPIKRFEKHVIVLEVSVNGIKKRINKEIPYYYDTEPKSQQGKPLHLKMASMNLPNESSRRVNTGEKIDNLVYEIESNYPETMNLAFHLSTHNGEDRQKPLIEQISLQKNITVKPYEKIEINCPDIIFDKDKYESQMLKGKVEIRAKVSAFQDFGAYEVADVIVKNSPFIIFLNQDGDAISQTFSEKNLIESNERRSKISGNKGCWVFNLYIQHPVYKGLAHNEDERKEYIAEELLKQILMAHLSEGNYTVLEALNGKNKFR